MDGKFYVRTILRDDGERLDFDAHELYLSADNVLLNRPEVSSTDVDYTDADGGEMISQRLSVHQQDFNGIVYPRTTPYFTLYTTLTGFFQINHLYKIVYKQSDGSLFAQQDAWISQNLQIPIQPLENYSNFSVSFKFRTSSLFSYREDSSGNEILSNTVTLPLLSASSGGESWDTVGQVWDTVGEVWLAGNGGVQTVFIDSISRIYPLWTVVGPCINPSLQNNTTDMVATYTGTVAAGQTLVVDFVAGVAKLDGAIVTRNVSGQVGCDPGDNVMGFNSTGGSTSSSTIWWNNIIG